MHDFRIYASADKLEKTERLARESDMIYKGIRPDNQYDRLVHIFSPSAPKIYLVVVYGTEEQFSDFVNRKLPNTERLF